MCRKANRDGIAETIEVERDERTVGGVIPGLQVRPVLARVGVAIREIPVIDSVIPVSNRRAALQSPPGPAELRRNRRPQFRTQAHAGLVRDIGENLSLLPRIHDGERRDERGLYVAEPDAPPEA